MSKPSPRMTDDECWEFVTDAHTGILTTLRRDGSPIALPMWFACVDRTIYLQSRGRKLQRIRNDSRASLLVEQGEQWAELKAVHVSGTAEIAQRRRCRRAPLAATPRRSSLSYGSCQPVGC